MTKNLDRKKLKLIEKITNLSSKKDIDGLEKFMESLDNKNIYSELFKPMREDISVEDLKKEQNYVGIDREEFDAIAKKLNIKKSLKELISMID